MIYRHVDTLRALGIEAFVLHRRPGFRCTWFDNVTPVTNSRHARLTPNDILVVPEYYGTSLSSVSAVPRLLVFNQRAYDTFDLIDYEQTPRGAPYTGLSNLVGLMTVSVDNAEYLRYAFPDTPVFRTRNVIDRTIFFPASASMRRHQIAFTPRRRGSDVVQLQHLLRARGLLDSWALAPVMGRSELETASIMRSSMIFISLNEREGFGLPPAEAMASGCFVVGYPGLAGREYFDDSYCSPVPEGDILALVRAVEQACEDGAARSEALLARGAAASEHILSTYSEVGLKADLSSVFEPLVR